MHNIPHLALCDLFPSNAGKPGSKPNPITDSKVRVGSSSPIRHRGRLAAASSRIQHGNPPDAKRVPEAKNQYALSGAVSRFIIG
ncbi:hypothetical protein VTL71DRAFT_9309 [Oculimacula yallundae]|uniref:Uncharacterized protein n=1 Tax=Oculimacula yallundae TaxID=86028 RepID=A0ABR4BVD7_9HELO